MATYKTASELTKMMIDYLGGRGMEVWRNNNLAVKGRSFIGRKGVPDIIGYDRKHGQFVGCEIKKLGDRISPEQFTFLTQLGLAGGASMLCSQTSDETIKLEIFKDGETKIFSWRESEKEFREAKNG
jgi:hypothetical protein